MKKIHKTNAQISTTIQPLWWLCGYGKIAIKVSFTQNTVRRHVYTREY